MCEATNRFWRIKCCHYAVYQDSESEEQQTGNKPSANDRQTDNRQAATNKKNKNNKKNNKLRREPSFDIEEIKREALYNEDYDI